MTDANKTTPATTRPRKMARQSQSAANSASPQTAAASAAAPVLAPSPAKLPSKSAMVLSMLQRAEGATLDQLVEATGWLPHTTRAALTGLKKKGHSVPRQRQWQRFEVVI